MFGRISYSGQRVFINDVEISGAQSCSSSSDIQKSPISVAGTGFYSYEVTETPESTFSVERLVMKGDPVPDLFFNEVSGYMAYGNNGVFQTLAFLHGRFASYKISCAVGEIPTSSFDVKAVGALGWSGEKSIPEMSYGSAYIARPSDLQMSNVDISNTNRIKRFEYSVSPQFRNSDEIGSSLDKNNKKAISPFVIDLSLSVDADDYTQEDLDSLLCSEIPMDISLSFVDCAGNTGVKIDAPNAILKSCSHQGGVGNDLSFDIVYSCCVNSTGDLVACLKGTYL